MIHLSVAIGRFVEALFYAILRVAGNVTLIVIGIALLGALAFSFARWSFARARRGRDGR